MPTKTLAQRLADNASEAAALRIEQAQAVKDLMTAPAYAEVIGGLDALYAEGLGSSVNSALSRVNTTLSDLALQAEFAVNPPPVVTPAAP